MPLETVNLFDKGGQDDKKFTPTPEELRVIKKKMQDPKFVELFKDYMKSMEDPETRHEEELYLQQVERDAKAGGDYSFDFVFPKPGFVVELLEPSTSYRVKQPLRKEESKKKTTVRVYVNMCSSEKIDPFREETTGDKLKSNWLVPVSISKPRTELFSEDNPVSETSQEKEQLQKDDSDKIGPVVVYDAVFHPTTLQLADHSDRFCCFLVNIAVEHINNGYGDQHGFQFRRLSAHFRSVGTLQNQTITREKGKSPFDAAKDDPVSTRPTKMFAPSHSAEKKSNDSSSRTEECADTQPTKKTTKKTKSATKGCSSELLVKDNLPRYTIAHRGNIDLTDTWGWKIVDQRVGVPKDLVVKMEFSGVQSAADLTVEVEGTYVIIAKSSAHPYYGSVTLPFSVDSIPLEAKFQRGKSILTLVLRVVPPAPTGITAADMRQELVGSVEEVKIDKRRDQKEVACEENGFPDENASALGTVDCDMNLLTDPSSAKNQQPRATKLAEDTLPVAQVSCIGDQDRVRLMMEKVQAARLQREETAAMAGEKLKAGDKVPEAAVKEMEGCNVSDKAAGTTVTEFQEEIEKNTFASGTTTPKTCAVDPPALEGSVESVRDDTQLELLRQRQDAWQRDLQQRVELKDEEERQAAVEAAREAHREAERLRKRAEAAKCQEAMEVQLRERMLELPLRNRYIFKID